MTLHWIQDWLWEIKEVVPPLCVELVLRDHTHYWLHSTLERDETTGTGVLRIWDLRALDESGVEALKARMNQLTDREIFQRPEDVHPKLDWANVRLHLADVAYCIEWHDRLWPEEERPRIGFHARTSTEPDTSREGSA